MKEDKQQRQSANNFEYDKQQLKDKDLKEYEDARRRIRANLFGDLKY